MGYFSNSQAYQETDIHTSSPSRLVVMLYQGAIRFLRQAESAIMNQDIEAKRVAVDRTLAILQHLQGSLSFDHSPDMANDLSRLYSYLVQRILDGSARLDVGPIHEAVKLLSTLLESWEEVARKEEVATAAQIAGGSSMEGRLTLRA